jgi:hypothetical protein
MSPDELHALAVRPGWTVDDRPAATYQLVAGGWRATIRILKGSGRGYDRYDKFHVVVIDPAGVCRYTKPTTFLPEAIRIAEGRVNAQA